MNLTDPNVNDISDAQKISIAPSATYVFDKGYVDYSWWYRLESTGAFFVTRAKKNTSLILVERRQGDGRMIVHDDIVKFKNKSNRVCICSCINSEVLWGYEETLNVMLYIAEDNERRSNIYENINWS